MTTLKFWGFALIAACVLPGLAGALTPTDPRGGRIGVVPEYEGEWIDVQVFADRTSYRVGDPVRLTIRASHDAHVFVYSTDGAGVTHQLLPNRWDRNNFLRQGQATRLPSSRYRLETSAAGWDSIHVVAVAPRDRRWGPPSEFHGYTTQEPFIRWDGGYPAARERLYGSLQGDDAQPSVRVRPRPPAASWGEGYLSIYVHPRHSTWWGDVPPPAFRPPVPRPPQPSRDEFRLLPREEEGRLRMIPGGGETPLDRWPHTQQVPIDYWPRVEPLGMEMPVFEWGL